MRDPVQSLWIGPELSAMERLSIRSFLANGHPFHLYLYDDVRGIPDGAEVRDAREILPESMIFQYSEYKTFAGFANYFRYKLLLDRGGWWSDVDSVCVRPLDFDAPYVFSSERHEGVQYINNGNLRAPRASAIFAEAWETCQAKDPATMRFGEMGPRLVSALVAKHDLGAFVQPPEVFCPLGYEEWERLLDPEPPPVPEETRAIHLWNEMWRRADRDKNAAYARASLYEQLKARYLR
jgi:hypothetical protein